MPRPRRPSQEDHPDNKKQRSERRRRRTAAEQQSGLVISIVGGVLILAILFIVLLSSRSNRQPPPEVVAAQNQREAKRLEKLLPDEVPTVMRRKKTAEELEEEERKRRQRKVLTGKALRDQINREYEAALRRSRLYKKQGDWGRAIKTFEEVGDRYDDEELRLRCQPEIDELREQSADAWRDAKRQADQLASNHKYKDAKKALEAFAKSCGIEGYAEECTALGEQYMGKRAAHLEAEYRTAHAAIDALPPQWKLAEAVEQAEALKFSEPEYQERHRRRVAELRAILGLQGAMIHKINRARPRISKRAIRAPGLAGDMASADRNGLKAESADGSRTDEYTWADIGPEAVMRLALLCGDPKDEKHRLLVGRFLLEVGLLKRAKMQLKAAKELGADTAGLEERLAAKEAAGGGGT